MRVIFLINESLVQGFTSVKRLIMFIYNFALNKVKRILLLVIASYQKLISPMLGQNCRHYPSCSQYSKQSLLQHGIAKGTLLTIFRILRCNPWSLGGYDPVPKIVSLKQPSSFKVLGNYQNELYKN